MMNTTSSTATLDLIESCLQNIYRIRTNSLLIRAKQHIPQPTMQRQQSDVTPYLNKVMQVDKTNADEEEEANLIKQLSMKLPKPSVPPPSFAGPSSANKKKRDEGRSSLPLPSKNTEELEKYDQKAQILFDQFVLEFEEIQQELQTFRLQLQQQKQTEIEEEEDEEGRYPSSINIKYQDEEEAKIEDICNYLIDKYLEQQLDTFPNSIETSNIKRQISAMVEELASSQWNYPSSIPSSSSSSVRSRKVERESSSNPNAKEEEKEGVNHFIRKSESSSSKIRRKVSFQDSKNDDAELKPKSASGVVKPVLKKESTGNNPTSLTATVHKKSDATNLGKASSTASTISKEETERKKIREQYEKFMALKKKNAQHPDNAAIEEYEKLNQEIQDVLSSVQHMSNI